MSGHTKFSEIAASRGNPEREARVAEMKREMEDGLSDALVAEGRKDVFRSLLVRHEPIMGCTCDATDYGRPIYVADCNCGEMVASSSAQPFKADYLEWVEHVMAELTSSDIDVLARKAGVCAHGKSFYDECAECQD